MGKDQGKQNARDAAKQVGMKSGETMSVQTKGQADNPHGKDGHVDGYAVTKNSDGSHSASKIKG